MGWITILENPKIEFFSLSEEFKVMVEGVIDFIMNVYPGIYFVLIVTIIVYFFVSIFMTVKKSLRDGL